MKRKQQQPWNQTFNDVRDSSGYLSRTKLHRQNHNNNVITLILVVIIGLIAVFALIYGLASNSLGHESGHRSTTKVSRVNHPHHKHYSDKHKSSGSEHKVHKPIIVSRNDRSGQNSVKSNNNSSHSSVMGHKTPASSANGGSNNAKTTNSTNKQAPAQGNHAGIQSGPHK